MNRKWIVLLLITFVLASCGNHEAEGNRFTPVIAQTSASDQGAEIEAYWKEFAPQIANKNIIFQEFEQKPLIYYITGLHNDDPLIRWYCAYKVTDYAGELSTEDRMKVDELLEDTDEDVKKAALFATELLKGTYEGDAFSRSSDGKMVAYYKYREARYNDGYVYVVRDGVTKSVFAEPSVTLLSFSPNNRYLFIGNGGRIWTGYQVTDLNTEQPVILPNLIMDIILDPSNGYDKGLDPNKIDRFDPWVTFVEWSPEGERFLYSYQFSDDKGVVHEGSAVMNLEENRITQVYKRVEDGVDPLADFTWGG
jgi:WD40 repeat protein